MNEATKAVIARMGSRPRKATEEELQELLAVGIAASNAELEQAKAELLTVTSGVARTASYVRELEAELAQLKAGSDPVAWIVTEHPTEFNDYTKKFRAVLDKPKCGTPLYTTPQPAPEVEASMLDLLAEMVDLH